MNTGEQLPPPSIQPVNPKSEQVREEDKIQLVLSYLSILALIPLITVKDNHYITWHAKNGLILGVGGGLAVALVGGILSALLGCFGALLAFFAGAALTIVDIMAMVKALNGERWRLPVVSDLADKL